MNKREHVRVNGRSITIDGEKYETGDTLEVDRRVIVRHPYTLRRVDGDDGENSGLEPKEVAPLDPEEYSIGSLERRLADANYSSEELAAIEELEHKGKDRPGALDGARTTLGT